MAKKEFSITELGEKFNELEELNESDEKAIKFLELVVHSDYISIENIMAISDETIDRAMAIVNEHDKVNIHYLASSEKFKELIETTRSIDRPTKEDLF